MNSPTIILNLSPVKQRRQHRAESVSRVSHREEISTTAPAEVGTLTDAERLAAIARADRSIDRHHELRDQALLEYDITGDFAAKGLADRHGLMAGFAQRLKEQLVAGGAA